MSGSLSSKTLQLFRLFFAPILFIPCTRYPSLLTQARQHAQEGHIKQAMRIYLKILKKNPHNIEALDELAKVSIEGGYIETAQHVLALANNFNPDRISTLIFWGFLHHQKKQPDLALNYFKRVLELQPDQSSARHFIKVLQGENPPQPDSKYVCAVFDEYAEQFDSSLLKTLKYRSHTNLVQLIKHHHPQWIINGLDLGCGTGLFVEEFQRLFSNSIFDGVDLSIKMLEKAKQKNLYANLSHIELHDHLKNIDKQYNLIVACDVIPYIGDLAPFFELCALRIEKNGLLAFCAEESKQTSTYILNETGRYQHHRKYFAELANRYYFTIKECMIAPLRTEARQPVPGLHYLLIKD